MARRFFKLLYVFALIAIVLWLPIYVLSSIQWDLVTITSYKAKCLSNNQYVVLQGSQVGEVSIYVEDYLNSSENRTAEKEQLNFYCKYYDEIQSHIFAYNEAKTPAEQYAANIRFREFEKTKDKVYAYPAFYTLEVESEESRPQEIYNPLLEGVIGALMAFILLQIIRICHVYVVYGKVVWHPFKRID
jgi:hypothetical protein